MEQWEYKVAGTDAEVMADFGTLVFADQTSMLNKMGKEGWATYTGTSFPNFGNSEYVIGLRTNTRTMVVNFVFKRISDDKEEARKEIGTKEIIEKRNKTYGEKLHMFIDPKTKTMDLRQRKKKLRRKLKKYQ